MLLLLKSSDVLFRFMMTAFLEEQRGAVADFQDETNKAIYTMTLASRPPFVYILLNPSPKGVMLLMRSRAAGETSVVEPFSFLPPLLSNLSWLR